MKGLISFLILVLFAQFVSARITLDYYLPADIDYDQSVPTPKSVIGHEVGEWHITHDRLVNYMRVLADHSPRISLQQYGRTHEGREQIILIITSPENHQNLSKIKTDHKQLTDPWKSSKIKIENNPAVVWQGYSIHGNEASGSNAALTVAYYYAAAQGNEIEEILDNLVIIMEPSMNPDGLTRFATWVNSRKSKNVIADPYNMEQNEFGPNGRTNHYWFDLNRDWLTIQQPESQNRVELFHEWKPNILTDHHEMSTNSTFFFQPGIPSRNNPNTPKKNFELTERIGTYHAKALDEIGALYYTKENYDDFFYGKGSTFPDINGGIGILFEQASSRGHAQESVHGVLEFPFTIRNQFVTSLSTVRAAKDLKNELLSYQRKFFLDAKKESKSELSKGIIFGANNDLSRANELVKILKTHEIQLYAIDNDITIEGKEYKGGKSFYIPLDQAQYKLIKVMFESVTDFKDSLFYDVSAWTLPLAYGLNYDFVNREIMPKINLSQLQKEDFTLTLEHSKYAYTFKWDDYFAPKMLWSLLDEDIICKVASEPFNLDGEEFGPGTIVVPVQMQSLDPQQLFESLKSIQEKHSIQIYSLNTGSTGGVNLGSRTLQTIKKPSLAMVVEDGVNANDAGEIWHLLDYRFDIPISLIPVRLFNRIDIDRYNTIVMVDGNYNRISAATAVRLKTWVQEGGKLIAFKGANNWLKSQKLISLDFIKRRSLYSEERRSYSDLGSDVGTHAMGGSIFSGNLDLTHPVAYGYGKKQLHVFVDTNQFVDNPDNPYSQPFQFDKNPLKSGYVSKENLNKIKQSAGIVVSRNGKGRIISFAFNPNYRAFWYGTHKLFFNAIYFGGMVDWRAAED